MLHSFTMQYKFLSVRDYISMIRLGNCTRKSYKDENVCHKIIVLSKKRTITLPHVVMYQSDGKIKHYNYF